MRFSELSRLSMDTHVYAREFLEAICVPLAMRDLSNEDSLILIDVERFRYAAGDAEYKQCDA